MRRSRLVVNEGANRVRVVTWQKRIRVDRDYRAPVRSLPLTLIVRKGMRPRGRFTLCLTPSASSHYP